MPDIAKVKRNIEKMITLGAPEADIDAYLASEGVSLDALQAPPPPPAYSGSILPLSRDQAGNVSFDSNAGLLGALKRAVTLPGDVATGQTPIMGEDGHTNPEVMSRSLELATVASPVNPFVASGERAIPGVLQAMKPGKPPSATALKEAASAGYDKARGMGVDIRGSAVGDAMRAVQSALEQDGIIAELAPKTFAILRKASEPPDGAIATIANVEAIRRALENAAKDFTNGTERLAATRSIRRLDEFLAGLPEEAVLAGPAAAAKDVLTKARGNYAAAMRSNKLTGELDDAITGAAERGDIAAAVANSGQNVGNSIRQRIAAILKQPKDVAGYSPEELTAMEGVARGNILANATRYIGNLLGGGGGLGQMLVGSLGAAGGAAGGGGIGAALGAALPVALGISSKRLSNVLTKKQLNKVDELIRKRSPLYEDMKKNPTVVISPEKRAALVRALLLEAQQQ